MVTKIPLVCTFAMGNLYNFIFAFNTNEDLIDITNGRMKSALSNQDVFVSNGVDEVLAMLNINIIADDYIAIYESDTRIELKENTKIFLTSVTIDNIDELFPTAEEDETWVDYFDILSRNDGDSKKNIKYKTFTIKIFKKGNGDDIILEEIVKPLSDETRLNGVKNLACFFCNQSCKKEYYENASYDIIGDIKKAVLELEIEKTGMWQYLPRNLNMARVKELVDEICNNVLGNFNKDLCPTYTINGSYVRSVKYDDFHVDVESFMDSSDGNNFHIYVITLVVFSDMLLEYINGSEDNNVIGSGITDCNSCYCYPSWLPKMKTCNISLDTLQLLLNKLTSELECQRYL